MILALALATIALSAEASPELRILPSDISLSGSGSSQQIIVVEWTEGQGSRADLTHSATFTSSRPDVAKVDSADRVIAVSEGRTTLRAELPDGRHATRRISVARTRDKPALSFRNHVLSVMTKAGCNSGPCHGAAAGRNHFKLSLRGYAPEEDYKALTRAALGRRVLPLAPAHSLILLKPTLALPHGGGKRFAVGSAEYAILAEWIANGATPPDQNDPRIEGLEILPRHVTLRPGENHRLLVQALFSDGHREDVTRWAKYSSSNTGAVTIGSKGMARAETQGEASLSVWYLNQVASARITVPFGRVSDPRVYAGAPRNGLIDDLALGKLKELELPPPRPASDSHFVRRAYLDALGLLPTAAEAKAFLADTAPDKRATLIDALLERPEFTDYWTYQWSDLLLVSSASLSPSETRAFYDWIRQAVEENRSWDRLVRQLVTSGGNNLENGAANYYVLHDEATKVAENISLTFMGLALACARCHNHPLDRWTQDDYYALSSYFSRIGRKTGDAGQTIIFEAGSGEVNHPRLGIPLPPRPLGASKASPITGDRREAFANWLTSSDNPYFARSIVNRIWYHFMGRGLVHPVDDLRESNPPSNQELMRALADQFTANDFDVKELIRAIMNSAVYQSSSSGARAGIQDRAYYTRFIVRRLSAEVILDIISQVTGVATQFRGYPTETRALQLPDNRVQSSFLTVFGRPKRELNSHAERVKDPTVSQALHLINSKTVHQRLRSPDSTLARLLADGRTDREIVNEVFWRSLSRAPEETELERLLATIAGAREELGPDSPKVRREVLEDLFAGILMSKEFLFNH